MLRLPAALRRQVVVLAKHRRESISDMVVAALELLVMRHEVEQEAMRAGRQRAA